MKRTLFVLALGMLLLVMAACHKAIATGEKGESPPFSVDGTKPHAQVMKPQPNKDTGRTLGERFGAQPFLELIDAPAKVLLKDGAGEIASNAQTCGACHQKIYQEWQESTHAYALKDPQFLAELSKASSPRWLCLNCHIPLKNQREYLVTHETKVLSSGHDLREIERINNPDFDASLQKEAITCATCHVRKNEAGQGIVVGPRGDTQAPHVVKEDKANLGDICMRCHTPDSIRMTPSFFCWFETDTERRAAGVSQTCSDCHMPSVQRPLAVGSQSRLTKYHTFAGSPVPKRFGDFGKTPRPSGLEISTTLEDKAGKKALVVRLKNTRGGHTIPTADPERHLLIEVRVGKGSAQKRFTQHIGQRWDFGDDKSGRPATRLEDTRILFGQERVYPFTLEWAGNSQPEIVTRVMHVRLSPNNAEHMKKARFDAELQGFHPGIEKKVAELEKNYPFFAYLFYETRPESSTSTPRVERLSDDELALKSQQAGDLSLSELKALLDEK